MWKGTNPVGVNEVTWPLFVLKSPSQFRPGPPPAHDSPERAAELAEVKNFKRTPFTNSKVSYWQFGQQGQPGVTFRLSEEVGRRLAEDGNVSAPRAARAYALVHVAQYEGWIASQDAKFHYWAARPNQFDTALTTVIPTPPFPTYPSNAATLVKAPAVVLTYLFPRERHATTVGCRSSANRAYGPASTFAATSRRAGRSGEMSAKRSLPARRQTVGNVRRSSA